jgi:hypothetical protein
MPDSTPSHTPGIHVRIPRSLWDAYGRVCVRKGRDRTEDLLTHIRRQIELLGDAEDLAALADAEQELAERRGRRGGRPRKTTEPGEVSGS